jgi:hypothetical protein
MRTGTSTDPLGALFHLPGRVWDWFVSTPSRQMPVGDDGLTDAERDQYAARFRRKLDKPPRPGSRQRAEAEVRAGTRKVVRPSHSR